MEVTESGTGNMYVDLGVLDSGISLHEGNDLILYFPRYLHNIAAIHDIDDHIDDDLPIHELNLYAFADRFESDQFGDFRAGGIGEAGHPVYFADSGLHHIDDHFFGYIDTALIQLAADIILTHNEPSKIESCYCITFP